MSYSQAQEYIRLLTQASDAACSLLNGYVVLLLANQQQQQHQVDEQQQQATEHLQGDAMQLPPMQTLLLDGYDGGNSSSMINDYRANPFHDLRTATALAAEQPSAVEPGAEAADEGREHERPDSSRRDINSGPNVRFCRVFDRGWPYLFIVSLRHLSAGEELLLDYQDDYWESRRQAGLGPKQTVPLTTG